MRKVFEIVSGARMARVYWNSEWEEFIVRFYTNGKWHGEECDYHESGNKYDKAAHADAKKSAISTARLWTQMGNIG
jgi:antitoxin component YwqK of YwqJK toxin-antitoxin module